MRLFQALLTVVWLIVVTVTALATNKYGVATAMDVFSNDLAAVNWRTQFNIDLLAHMFFVGLWAAWRQAFAIKGIVVGLLCAFGGSLFSLIFIVALSVQNRGDMKKILMGVNAEKYA